MTASEPAGGPRWPSWPRADGGELAALERCLRRGGWSRGEEIGAFERAFAAYCGSRHCLLVHSGTEALRLSLQALGVGPGDEVIVPGLTWPATALAVLLCGATAVVVDVDPETLCLATAAARAAITPRTRAILPVHLYCSAAPLDELLVLAAEHDLALVEDVAQAHGCVWRGRKLGAWGRLGAFSFQEKKLLTCGEGGCVITDDEELWSALTELRDLELPPGPRRQRRRFGGNGRLATFNAAILLARLARLPALLEQEREAAQRLLGQLSDLDGVVPLRRPADITAPTWYSFCLRLTDERLAARAAWIRAELTARCGVPVAAVYPPLDQRRFFDPGSEPSFRGLLRLSPLPNCHQAHRAAIRFPHQVLLAPPEQLDRLADVLRATLAEARGAGASGPTPPAAPAADAGRWRSR